MSKRGDRFIWCEQCQAVLAHVDPNGDVWWVNGWHRPALKDVPMEDPRRNILEFTKPHRTRSHGVPTLLFHRPIRQRCHCGFIDTVD